MVFPRWLARFNRKVTNRVTTKLAGGGGPWSIVVHVGRNSHKTYRTPVTVFVDGDTYRIALTYGPGADWVRNVLAADEFWLEHRRVLVHLTSPQVAAATDVMEHVPAAVRSALSAIGTDHFLVAQE